MKKQNFLSTNTFKIAIATVLIVMSCAAYYFYSKLLVANVVVEENEQEYLYIPTGSSFTDLINQLEAKKYLKDVSSFKTAADLMKFDRVKAGRYKMKPGISNRVLINMLKSGNQEPVQLTFNNLRLKEDFAGYVGTKLEFDSTQFIDLLNDESFLKKYNTNPEIVYTLFLPNTYQVYWNTSAEDFFVRMYDEYQKFWNEERIRRAEEIGLTPVQISILASIVNQETSKTREMPTIAGVYINRLRQGMRLEADPTVVFSLRDFSIRRVLSKYLLKDSPYNTYMYTGLPPGPICMPSIAAINAVLNFQQHNYLFFCAKEDFSGYHNFANNMAAHRANARKFQHALSQRKIYN